MIIEAPNWRYPIIQYLKSSAVTTESESAKLRIRAARYILIEDVLYKKSFSLPFLRCLRPEEAQYALREIHEGICGQHMGSRSLSYKALRQGYYWPTMKRDSASFVQKCDKCQRFAKIAHQPPEELCSLVAPWPFAQWGLDILGPFPLAKAQKKFLIVACEYFTKWVEAEAVAAITQKSVEKFLWENIICRFDIPQRIIIDNGP